MKRLSLEELKAQKAEQVTQNLENISGGDFDWCHFWSEVKHAFTHSTYANDSYGSYTSK